MLELVVAGGVPASLDLDRDRCLPVRRRRPRRESVDFEGDDRAERLFLRGLPGLTSESDPVVSSGDEFRCSGVAGTGGEFSELVELPPDSNSACRLYILLRCGGVLISCVSETPRRSSSPPRRPLLIRTVEVFKEFDPIGDSGSLACRGDGDGDECGIGDIGLNFGLLGVAGALDDCCHPLFSSSPDFLTRSPLPCS